MWPGSEATAGAMRSSRARFPPSQFPCRREIESPGPLASNVSPDHLTKGGRRIAVATIRAIAPLSTARPASKGPPVFRGSPQFGRYRRSVAAGELRVTRTCAIPLPELEWRFTRSGGPGGQHANTSDTRAEVRFDIASSPSLGPRQRARLLSRFGPVVRVVASDTRSQARNRELALERLRRRLADGLRRPESPRRPTRPTRAARRSRLDAKRKRAETKRRRRPPAPDD